MRNLLPEDFALPNLSVQFTSPFRLPGFLCASLTKVKYTGSSGCWSKRVSFFQKILRGVGELHTRSGKTFILIHSCSAVRSVWMSESWE